MSKTKDASIMTLFKDVDIAALPRGIYEVVYINRYDVKVEVKFVKLSSIRWFALVGYNWVLEYTNNEMRDVYHSFRLVQEL
jgi:hypothetical protein